MSSIPKGKSYAQIIRDRLRDPKDRRSIRQVGRNIGFSYEHVRKLLAGEVTFSRSFNDSLCAYLNLPPDHMWDLAQTEKLRKRYSGAGLRPDLPRDTRVREIWAAMSSVQRDSLVDVGRAILRSST